mgnify:CR=1 FL=1
MGLMDIFKKKSEPILLKLEDLNEWLDKQVEKKEIGTALGIMKREIQSKLTKLEELLKNLEYATLKNPAVYPERAISIMEGNRKAYLQKVRNFTTDIKFPEKYEDIKEFLEETSNKLDALAQDTQKNFFIIKEFMGNEVSAVANKLREMDKTIAEARKQLESTVIDTAKEVKQKLNEYYKAEQEIYEIRKKAEIIEQIKQELYEKRSKIEEKINKIKTSPGYSELQNLIEKKEELKEQIREAEKKIHSFFSEIEPAIKKYHNKAKSKISETYLADSIKAFIEDEELKIKEELQKISSQLETLELKPAKLKRIKETLENKEIEKLHKSRTRIKELKENLEELLKRIKNHPTKLNVKEQEAWLLNIDKELEEQQNKIEEIENELERRNLKLIKQQISKKIKELDKNAELVK